MQAGSLRHGERLQPGLTQRDMWVMHRLVQRGVLFRDIPLLKQHLTGYLCGRGSTCPG